MTSSISDHQTGGQKRYRKDTCFSYSGAFMVRGRPPVNGILIYQRGWKTILSFVDAATGYRWLYGSITKDDAIKASRKWYRNIADLRTKHKWVVLMRDNASEYESEEVMQFLAERGIRSHFSTPKEQWQNGAAESTINSIMLIARTVMAESGLGGQFGSRQPRLGKMPEMSLSRSALK